jgi:hypothetical protein
LERRRLGELVTPLRQQLVDRRLVTTTRTQFIEPVEPLRQCECLPGQQTRVIA